MATLSSCLPFTDSVPLWVSQGLPILLSPWPGDLFCNPLYRTPNPMKATPTETLSTPVSATAGSYIYTTWESRLLGETTTSSWPAQLNDGVFSRLVRSSLRGNPSQSFKWRVGTRIPLPPSFWVSLAHQAGVGGICQLYFAVLVFLLHPTSLFLPSTGKKDGGLPSTSWCCIFFCVAAGLGALLSGSKGFFSSPQNSINWIVQAEMVTC